MMGVTGDIVNEGYKIMATTPQMIDAATNQNIIGEGRGYWRMAGRFICL